MGKGARSSAIKKNNQALKKKVFGPVETARNERLSAKLLELAKQPRPVKSETEVEQGLTDSSILAKKSSGAGIDAQEDVDMAVDKPVARSNGSLERQKRSKVARVEKRRHRRARNDIIFPRHPKKPVKKGSRR